jgi:hypothetical protein
MICVNLTGLVLPSENTYAAAVFVARCENKVSIPLVCLSIGCRLGWPAGLVVWSAWASNPLRSGEPGDLIKSCLSCPGAAVSWEGCPFMYSPMCPP